MIWGSATTVWRVTVSARTSPLRSKMPPRIAGTVTVSVSWALDRAA